MQTVIIVIVAAAAVISAVDAKPTDVDDERLQSAFCKVTKCASPGVVMPKILYDDGLAKCKTLETECYSSFRQCAEGIAKIIRSEPKTPENKDVVYDLTSDAFLNKLKKAIISYSAHHRASKSATQKYLLMVKNYSPVWYLSWFECEAED